MAGLHPEFPKQKVPQALLFRLSEALAVLSVHVLLYGKPQDGLHSFPCTLARFLVMQAEAYFQQCQGFELVFRLVQDCHIALMVLVCDQIRQNYADMFYAPDYADRQGH